MALQMRQNLGMRMEQKLKLTPQMIQSIEILLLPQMALEERIMQEIESNPVLDIAESDAEIPEGPDGAENPDAPIDSVAERTEQTLRESQDDHEVFQEMLKARRDAARMDEDSPDKMAAIASTAGPPPVLAQFILDQLHCEPMTDDVREVLSDLAWALDRRGYLNERLAELFPEDQLPAAETAWEMIRGCEPAGLGAKDLADCLTLQLEREHGDNSFELDLIRDHLDNVLRNRLPVIAQELGVDIERVQEGVEVISRLDPQPGLPFGGMQNHVVIPDVIAERSEAGDWSVEIPDAHLPKVEINGDYQQLHDDSPSDSRERHYLKEQLSSARFLIDAVAQRKRTLLKIAVEIVKHQKLFLDQGPEQLRPLMRQDIADQIGMHVATVSRAVKDKYIQTPSGIIPLAAFFSGGIATQDGGEAESSRSVKLKIKAMVDKENPRKPLSDQAIADALAKDGLDISRRTVTKYRLAMDIPSTRQRRRFAD